MKKIAVAILSCLLIVSGVIFVFAQSGEGAKDFGKRGHRGGGHGFFLRGLDLTDEQKAQFKQIMEASREKNKGVFEQLKANRQKLDEITANGAFDEAQVTAIAQQQAALHAQMIVERERVKAQIFAILTDEQRAKATEMREKMKERFKNKMNRFQSPEQQTSDE